MEKGNIFANINATSRKSSVNIIEENDTQRINCFIVDFKVFENSINPTKMCKN